MRRIAFLVLLFGCVHADADIQPGGSEREGFSLFSLGGTFLDYEESTVRNIGDLSVDVETESSLVTSQRSGTFIATDGSWGAWLLTESTLGLSRSTERWEVDDVAVRENQVSFELQSLAALGSRRLGTSAHHLVAGVRYRRTSYSRFGANVLDPSIVPDSVAEGTVIETLWSIDLVLGYERGTLFLSLDPSWQYHLRMTLGTPLYASISNTDVAEGRSYSSSFEGFQAGVEGVFGYRFSEHVVAGLDVTFTAGRRNAIDVPADQRVGGVGFPSNDTLTLYTGFGVYWSF